MIKLMTEARGSAPGFLLIAMTVLIAGCANPARDWGRDELARIEDCFALHGANEGLYRERLISDQIAFAWPLGVQLTALTAAARIDRAYVPRVRQVIDACRRVTGHKIPEVMGQRRPGDPPELVAAAGRARELLGWEPAMSDCDTIVETAWRWHQR